MKKYEGKRYYHIRATVFWLAIGLFVLLLLGAYFKDELYEKWLRSGGMEDVTFQGLTCALEDKGSCYLCGSSDYSLVDLFRKSGRIGVISLNDWYVLKFHIKSRDESVPSSEEGYRTFASGNTGEIIYSSEGSYSGKIASIEVTLPGAPGQSDGNSGFPQMEIRRKRGDPALSGGLSYVRGLFPPGLA
mgnify:FL=1